MPTWFGKSELFALVLFAIGAIVSIFTQEIRGTGKVISGWSRRARVARLRSELHIMDSVRNDAYMLVLYIARGAASLIATLVFGFFGVMVVEGIGSFWGSKPIQLTGWQIVSSSTGLILGYAFPMSLTLNRLWRYPESRTILMEKLRKLGVEVHDNKP